MILTADPRSEYSMRRALRDAGFKEHAIDAAMRSLFPEPEPEPFEPGTFLGTLQCRIQDRPWAKLPDAEVSHV
jgi:hypothetical protein